MMVWQMGNEQLEVELNTVADAGGVTQTLAQPYLIVVNKAAPISISPLIYTAVRA